MSAEQSIIRESNTTTPYPPDLVVKDFQEQFGRLIESSFNDFNPDDQNYFGHLNTNYSTTAMRTQGSTSPLASATFNHVDPHEAFIYDSTPSISAGSGTTVGMSNHRNSRSYRNGGVYKPPLGKMDISLSEPSRSTSRSKSGRASSSISPGFDTNMATPLPVEMPLSHSAGSGWNVQGFLDSGSSANIKKVASATPSLFVNNWSPQTGNVPRSFTEPQRSFSFDEVPGSAPSCQVQEGCSRTTPKSKIIAPRPINKCAPQPSPSSSSSSSIILDHEKMLNVISGPKTKTVPKNPAIYKSDFCEKRYTRRDYCRSHMKSHFGPRPKPFKCKYCQSPFKRKSDCKRHEKTHTEEERFVCGGYLKDGAKWGCGHRFTRLDCLRDHYTTRQGIECKRPFLEEEERYSQK
ncbi:CRZ1 [[Candida] subhashii]|uniref:CRZ1 n=1 Tax=[Candida] subhashii TaxID=561895 RepID=A0A8J5QMA6_9ASCO|nr:CRZ1 [[Candida] subhashii]KAG7664708.1 CRZ1 [[Candida] subhashii]